MTDAKQDSAEAPPRASMEEQAEVASSFLSGLLEAFGLEGTVETRTEDDILYLDVQGEQTEALVGPKGSVMQSVLELTRTVVQRKTFGAPRMRIDIAGYAERRREALRIYAAKLADRVLSERGEVMLEPMNAADRKVVHDAVTEIDGVRTFSEGQDPDRAVVIAPTGEKPAELEASTPPESAPGDGEETSNAATGGEGEDAGPDAEIDGESDDAAGDGETVGEDDDATPDAGTDEA
jgi:spoIIIJ-associated protein